MRDRGRVHDTTSFMDRWRRAGPWFGVLAALSGAVLLVCGAVGSTAAGARPLNTAAVPTPGTSSRLLEVSCSSASHCFAVGTYTTSNASLNEALLWNGTKWSLVPTPQPGTTATTAVSDLFSVDCLSGSDCWAAGNSQAPGGPELNEMLHWNGKKWALVPTPQPAGTGAGNQQELLGVSCAGAEDCWATGIVGSPSASQNEALHYNGRKWALVPTPQPAGTGGMSMNILERDTCLSTSDCWAAGAYVKGSGPQLNQLLHWNGKKWSRAVAPHPAGTGAHDGQVLAGVTCAAPSDCWATGAYAPNGSRELNQALHFNGKKWSSVPTPQPAGDARGDANELIDPACISATDCWAAGLTATKTGDPNNQVLHWNGKKWSNVSVPQPAGTTPQDPQMPGLYGIHCVSAVDCWAVGASHLGAKPSLNEIMHWNGKKWTRG